MGDRLAQAAQTAQYGRDLFGKGGPYSPFAQFAQRPFGNFQEPPIPGTPDTGFRTMTGLSNPVLGPLMSIWGRQALPFSGDPAGLPGALGNIGALAGAAGPWGPVDTGGGGEGGEGGGEGGEGGGEPFGGHRGDPSGQGAEFGGGNDNGPGPGGDRGSDRDRGFGGGSSGPGASPGGPGPGPGADPAGPGGEQGGGGPGGGDSPGAGGPGSGGEANRAMMPIPSASPSAYIEQLLRMKSSKGKP